MKKQQLNKLATEYKSLKDEFTSIEARIKEIAEIFKNNGSVDTGDFMVVISDVEQERLAALAKVAEVFGRKELEKQGLINTISFQTVRVTEKKAA